MKNYNTLSVVVALLFSNAAMAGGGVGSGGGGGNMTESDFRHDIELLAGYFQTNSGKAEFPKIADYNRDHPKESFNQMIRKVRVRVVNGIVRDARGVERDCVSMTEPVRIFICNGKKLPDMNLENQPRYLRLTGHELFVQAGFEKPLSKLSDIYVPSEYPYSAKLGGNMHLASYQEWVPGKESSFTRDLSPMPKMHKIMEATLTAPYGCNELSYEKSALFLSQYSASRNSPDLLYYGCGSSPTAQVSTAGDDFSLISDLGEVSIEDVTASKAMNLTNRVDGDNAFKATAELKLNHTYSVIHNKSDIRALFVFKVIELTTDGPMKIQYAVESYSVQQSRNEATGFGWEKKNK